MSLKKLVEDGVDLAFQLLDDLKSTGQLTQAAAPTFDFSTSETTEGLISSKAVRFVELDAGNRKVSDVKKLLLIDTTDLRHFSEITINGASWRIGEIVHEARFVSLVEVHR